MTRILFPKKSDRWTELVEIQDGVKSDFWDLKTKSSKNFKNLWNLRKIEKKKKIKWLQSDNSGESRNEEFDNYLKEYDIIRKLIIAHNPEQNGIAERKKSHINWDGLMPPYTVRSITVFLGQSQFKRELYPK